MEWMQIFQHQSQLGPLLLLRGDPFGVGGFSFGLIITSNSLPPPILCLKFNSIQYCLSYIDPSEERVRK